VLAILVLDCSAASLYFDLIQYDGNSLSTSKIGSDDEATGVSLVVRTQCRSRREPVFCQIGRIGCLLAPYWHLPERQDLFVAARYWRLRHSRERV
jgi:hypothetical protein